MVAASAIQSHRRRDGACELFVDANLFFLPGTGRNICTYQFTIPRGSDGRTELSRSGTNWMPRERVRLHSSARGASERPRQQATRRSKLRRYLGDRIRGCRIRHITLLNTPRQVWTTNFLRSKPGRTSFRGTKLSWTIRSSHRFVRRPGCRILGC